MSKEKKITPTPLSVPPFGSISEIMKGVADVGSAAMISKAIREHTRAMVADSYYARNHGSLVMGNSMERLMKNANEYADKLIAAGKPKSENTTADEVPESNT